MGKIPSVKKRLGCSVEELMISRGLSQSDLSEYHQATLSQSRSGSNKLMNALPADVKERIASFYRDLREAGIYPDKPNEQGEMQYQEIVDYDEAWKRRLENREMFPPPPQEEDEELPF